jgi:putative ABC transport system permease protein
MELSPILSALRRNKVGAILIAVQMAVTVAILCNGLFISQQRLVRSHSPSGTDEPNIFVIANQWVVEPGDLPSRVTEDLVALRSLTEVVDAYATNSYPLSNSGTNDGISLQPNQKHSTTTAALYYGDEHALHTLGLTLVAGRNFNADEIIDQGENGQPQPAGVIVTRTLADKLYPRGNALGRTLFMTSESATTRIVGIVERLQIPWVGGGPSFDAILDNSVLVPYRPIWQSSYYVVRARSGQLPATMKAAQKQLTDISRERVIEKVQPLLDARIEAHRNNRGFAVFLSVVCAVLLVVTAFGIVGLTSYWVAQRRRQIGIRRALGATRSGIVRYFQTENLLIAAAAAAVGAALANALNLLMVGSFEMARLPIGYTVAGAVAVLLLGQFATLWPALRAASIPPAIAARGA